MLIVMYKPNSDNAIPDAKVKQQADEWIADIPVRSNQYVCISQMLMVDAIRAAIVERNVSPDLVTFEVYNTDNELVETVNISSNYTLSSWNAFRHDMMDFLQTIMGAKKNGSK